MHLFPHGCQRQRVIIRCLYSSSTPVPIFHYWMRRLEEAVLNACVHSLQCRYNRDCSVCVCVYKHVSAFLSDNTKRRLFAEVAKSTSNCSFCNILSHSRYGCVIYPPARTKHCITQLRWKWRGTLDFFLIVGFYMWLMRQFQSKFIKAVDLALSSKMYY